MSDIERKPWMRLEKQAMPVKVSDGYARNYLIPKKLAIEAELSKISKVLEHEKKNILQRAEKDRKVAGSAGAKIFRCNLHNRETHRRTGQIIWVDHD